MWSTVKHVKVKNHKKKRLTLSLYADILSSFWKTKKKISFNRDLKDRDGSLSRSLIFSELRVSTLFYVNLILMIAVKGIKFIIGELIELSCSFLLSFLPLLPLIFVTIPNTRQIIKVSRYLSNDKSLLCLVSLILTSIYSFLSFFIICLFIYGNDHIILLTTTITTLVAVC